MEAAQPPVHAVAMIAADQAPAALCEGFRRARLADPRGAAEEDPSRSDLRRVLVAVGGPVLEDRRLFLFAEEEREEEGLHVPRLRNPALTHNVTARGPSIRPLSVAGARGAGHELWSRPTRTR